MKSESLGEIVFSFSDDFGFDSLSCAAGASGSAGGCGGSGGDATEPELHSKMRPTKKLQMCLFLR